MKPVVPLLCLQSSLFMTYTKFLVFSPCPMTLNTIWTLVILNCTSPDLNSDPQWLPNSLRVQVKVLTVCLKDLQDRFLSSVPVPVSQTSSTLVHIITVTLTPCPFSYKLGTLSV